MGFGWGGNYTLLWNLGLAIPTSWLGSCVRYFGASMYEYRQQTASQQLASSQLGTPTALELGIGLRFPCFLRRPTIFHVLRAWASMYRAVYEYRQQPASIQQTASSQPPANINQE